MGYYDESKSERRNRHTAFIVTAVIYFIIFTGIIFASRPELLPETVKEWLNIESSTNQKDIKQEKPLDKKNQDKA